MAPELKTTVNIEDEMKTSYMDYSMSVIVGRALPDVRDGLKPVHRRVLYAMHAMGLTPNKPYRKSARVVGDVIGKYHPHGDAAVYDTMVRLVQGFAMRCPLIDGQGNFGSVDGDAPAAMRYTEVRLAKIAREMLADIEKETVDFGPNYDGLHHEPLLLPARIPNLLINGTTGIAVGMATNIPPHNLGEVVDGLLLLLDSPNTTVKRLMKAVQGPDFPTAGFIHGLEGIRNAYETGRGIIQMRARAFVETRRGDRESIIVSELPYQVNKANLLQKIGELVRDKKITGLSDVRDESDREGMRIVLELKRGEIVGVVLNQLFKHTQMQSTYGVIMLALVDGQPRVLNLKELLTFFLLHRREVVIRRTQYELRRAEERAHILEGLKKALDHLDAVIALIRRSKSPEEARTGLMNTFELTQVQAQAILDMKLQRLTALEREKIVQEYQEVLKQIEHLRSVLGSEALVTQIIREELQEVKQAYADPRRTEIMAATQEIALEDLIAEEEMVITVSHSGYIKRNPLSLYRAQHRGGKGKIGMETREADFVKHLFVASTHSYLLFFSDAGKVYWLKVHQVPEAGRQARGKAIVNLLQLARDERITMVLPVKEFRDDQYVVMATRNGIVKKTVLTAYGNPRAGGIIALSLDEGDELIDVGLSDGQQDIFLGTRDGLAIRFPQDQVRSMGRTARGVTGIRLRGEDRLVGMELVTDRSAILIVTARGYGKCTDLPQYRSQSRGGKGMITLRVTERNGPVLGIVQVTPEDEVIMITGSGKIIRVRVSEISTQGRATQGVRLFDIDPADRVMSVARLAEKEETPDATIS